MSANTKIFLNLPVNDLNRSMDFFSKLGFTNNPQFTDETAACMVISENIFTMLLTHAKFKEFTPNEIADASRITEVITCLSCESKDEVNKIADLAISLGGKTAKEPLDFGFMYSRSFHDLDGHIWEFMWMDMNAAPGQAQ